MNPNASCELLTRFERNPTRPLRLIVMCMALGGLTTAVCAQEPRWAEGEHYLEQFGSQRVDLLSFGSGGQCLGSNWGGAKGHFAVYRFWLDAPLDHAVLAFRYARLPASASRFALSMDDRPIAEVVFPPTGGWGHRAAGEWRYVEVALGNVSAGWHTLRLESSVDDNNTNLDGFFLASAPLDPPHRKEQIEGSPKLQLMRRDRGWSVDENLRIDDFAPVAEDLYYPPEERREREALSVPSLARWDGERAVLRSPVTGEERAVSPGDSLWDWHVVAPTQTPRALVLERRLPRWGTFLYLDETGVLAEIRKAVGQLEGIVHPVQKYPPGYLEWVQHSHEDVLGLRVLAGGEPSFERASGWLPDLTGYTFLATRAMQEKLAVGADGTLGPLSGVFGLKRIEDPLFDPRKCFPKVCPTQAKRGVLGGFLPVMDYGFLDEVSGQGFEQIAFATSAGTFVALRSDSGWRTFAVDPVRELPAPGPFFEALLALHREWHQFTASGIAAELPERRLVDASWSGLIRTRITYAGDRPKYGLGHYAAPEHDAFPPTTLWTVEAELAWGLFAEARQDLEYYLHNLVKPDGTFDYYGPAVSEYGMMLDTMVRFARYTGDREWLSRHHEVADSLCDHLLRLRRTSLERTEAAPGTAGLLFGSPEADTRDDVQYYYSGSMWAWRGLLEWGRLLSEFEPWRARGQQLVAEAAALREDILQSVEQCTVEGDPDFLPPYPGLDVPFESMIEDTRASYTNYRYWLEMLSAEFLSPDQAAALVEYRRRHQGECLGMTRFMGQLDDWPLANYSRALLALDRVDHFLLGYYGHLATHQMRGTFSDFEQVYFDDVAERSYRADYCVPAQLTIPLLTRGMLVFEERDEDALWLCRAVPRRWFAPGQKWEVRGAPTRWGPVSLTVEAEQERVVVQVTPPDRGVERICLRVRPPSGGELNSATVNGRPAELDAEGSVVVLRKPSGPCKVVVQF